MGIYFRKSFGRGPVRLNLSKSGLGVSVGVKGARLSVGPRGTHVHIGRGGIYYRQRLDVPPSVRHSPSGSPPGQPALPFSGAPVEAIATAPVHDLTEISNAELLTTINERIAKFPFAWLAGLFTLFSAYGIGCLAGRWAGPEAAGVAWFAAMILGMIGTGLVHRQDRSRRCTHLNFEFDDWNARQFAAHRDFWLMFGRCHKIWRVTARHNHGDWKYNAGATQSVARQQVSIRIAQPPFLDVDFPVACFDLRDLKLFFFPEWVLIYQNGTYGAVEFGTLQMEPDVSLFRESDPLPRDSHVVEYTWQYVNMHGGPDRRFKHNPRVPVVAYPTFNLQSPAGLDVRLMFSRFELLEEMSQASAAIGSLDSNAAD